VNIFLSLGLPLTDERLHIMMENHEVIIGRKSLIAVFGLENGDLANFVCVSGGYRQKKERIFFKPTWRAICLSSLTEKNKKR